METIKKAKLVLVDNRILENVYDALLPHAKHVKGFHSEGITYNAVSCHPDVFIHQGKDINILAPNTPTEIIKYFRNYSIPFIFGKEKVGSNLKDSTPYNCLATNKSLLHKSGFTDRTIINHHAQLAFINLPQAYTRCTTLVLQDGIAISSDNGVIKVLRSHGWEVLYFDPSEISIEDHKNGFLGGCCGLFSKTIFTLGNPLLHSDGERLEKFISSHGYTLQPLCNSKLYDGGGILFFE